MKKGIFHKITKFNINFLNVNEDETENNDSMDSKKTSAFSHLNILESMKYSNAENFLKRIISYKKFFKQYSPKTFTFKKEEIDESIENIITSSEEKENIINKNNYEQYESSSPVSPLKISKNKTSSPSKKLFLIEIKKLICEIFSYILALREDAQLDNFFHYFTKDFIEKEENIKEFKNLFPFHLLKVREKIDEINAKERELFNLDIIMERPFLEILIISFFLAYNSELEEKIMGLIQQGTTQTKRFFANLKKLQLLTTTEEKRTYIKINKYIERLKISNFTTQVRIYSNFYNLFDNNKGLDRSF